MTGFAERLLTPSKVTAWLDCPHHLTLSAQVDEGTLQRPESTFGSFAELLVSKGQAHEQDCLAEYRRQGKSILEVPGRADGQSFADWVQSIGDPLADDYDVIYQMPFVHNGIRGIADFLLRHVDPGTGEVSYEPVDAKLARAEAKPGHVLQLCFYAEAIEAATGRRPEHMHIWLGSGRLEQLRVADFQAYWRRLRTQLAAALAAGPADGTTAQPCAHCDFCEFHPVCEKQWREADSLIYVANIRQPDIAALVDADVTTLAALAAEPEPPADLDPERLARLRGQAALQLIARDQPDTAPPPFKPIAPGEGAWGHGQETLPAPDAGDVFLDFEGHPFWRADTGLFFLFGLIEQGPDNDWRYHDWWAHSPEEEAAAAGELIRYLAGRRAQFPNMHVYHYNHTERSSLQRLAATHGVEELVLAQLVDTGAFVDLLLVARNSFQVGTESYGLKHLERLTDFVRGHEIDQGAGAVVHYEHYMANPDPALLDAIAAYNEDDVRATRALRDWLVDHRDPALPWRDACTAPDPNQPQIDEAVARLHQFAVGTDEHNLGDLLCYWRDEWFAYLAPKMAKLESEPIDVLDDAEVIAGLRFVEMVPRTGKTKRTMLPAMRFTFPKQDVDRIPVDRDRTEVMVATPLGERATVVVDALDVATGVVDLVQSERCRDIGCIPTIAVLDDWVLTGTKYDALSSFAQDVLEDRDANPVTLALLRGDLPRFTDGVARVFADDLDDMTDWVTRLDHSYVAVQVNHPGFDAHLVTGVQPRIGLCFERSGSARIRWVGSGRGGA